MNIYFILCQLIATITFLIMCKLILVAPTSKFFSISLYVYIPFCCLGIAPFSGQLGTPLLLLGAFTILLFFNKAYRLYNLLFFQILWAWSVLTDYAVTIPLRIAGYDFDVILTSLPLTLLFSILHALLCILPCLFIGNRLHRKLVTDQNVIPPRIQLLLFLEVTICSCIFLINIIFGSLLHYPSDILFFNGILIFCFATANVLIFLMLYNTLQANKKLELQACSVGGGRILVNKVDAPNPDYAMDNRKNVTNWFDGELDESCWSVKDNMAAAMADPKAGPILKQIREKAAASRGDVAAAVKDNPALVAMMERAMQRMTIQSMLMQAGTSEEDIKQLNRVLQGIAKE